jgi:hypothetical protein
VGGVDQLAGAGVGIHLPEHTEARGRVKRARGAGLPATA